MRVKLKTENHTGSLLTQFLISLPYKDGIVSRIDIDVLSIRYLNTSTVI